MQLVATDVQQAFGGTEVLRGVDFAVAQGDRVAIIGPSGSGKSSLLAILGGLSQPRAGQIEIREGPRTLLARRDVRRGIAWILQTTTALGTRSTQANVSLAARLAGVKNPEQQSRRALESVGLGDVTSRQARFLSGGELQRLAIARAIASDRPFILADEPTGQLDAKTSDRVLDQLVTSVDEEGLGLVVVTHDEQILNRFHTVYRLTNGTLGIDR